MPYRLDWEPQGVCRTYFGNVSIAERKESHERICGDPRFDEIRWAITDYLAVQAYEVTPEATAEIAALHIGPLLTNPRIVIAAVAVRPDIVAAIDDFIRLGYTAVPYRVFATMGEARAWVGLLSA